VYEIKDFTSKVVRQQKKRPNHARDLCGVARNGALGIAGGGDLDQEDNREEAPVV
jgi:hypothetical protein